MQVFGIGYTVNTRITRHTFEDDIGDDEKAVLVGPNESRVGYLIYNDSSGSILIAEDNNPATNNHFTTKIGGQTEYGPKNDQIPYTGEITYKSVGTNAGAVLVTEYVLDKRR